MLLNAQLFGTKFDKFDNSVDFDKDAINDVLDKVENRHLILMTVKLRIVYLVLLILILH